MELSDEQALAARLSAAGYVNADQLELANNRILRDSPPGTRMLLGQALVRLQIINLKVLLEHSRADGWTLRLCDHCKTACSIRVRQSSPCACGGGLREMESSPRHEIADAFTTRWIARVTTDTQARSASALPEHSLNRPSGQFTVDELFGSFRSSAPDAADAAGTMILNTRNPGAAATPLSSPLSSPLSMARPPSPPAGRAPPPSGPTSGWAPTDPKPAAQEPPKPDPTMPETPPWASPAQTPRSSTPASPPSSPPAGSPAKAPAGGWGPSEPPAGGPKSDSGPKGSGPKGWGKEGKSDSGPKGWGPSEPHAGGPPKSDSGPKGWGKKAKSDSDPKGWGKAEAGPGKTKGEPRANVRFGRYLLGERLGEGGMGVIHKTRLDALDLEGAIKILGDSASPPSKTDIERFLRESRLLGRMRHQHIIRVFDAGQVGSRYFYVMELIKGRDVDAILKNRGPFEVGRGFRLLAGVARALAYAHERGVLHRDIKPANIMIEDRDNPVLMDFGLGRQMAEDSSLTQKGQAIGTPYYMSPEQVEASGNITELSDIYALGVTAYHMLTGLRPFEANRMMEVYQKILSATPAPPSKVSSTLKKKHDKVLLKAMARREEDRYQSMEELAEAFEKYATKRSPS